MCSHILVPLDGSALAESALSHAVALARLSVASLTLLVTISPAPAGVLAADEAPVDWERVGDIEALAVDEAESYLRSVRPRLGDGLPVHLAVRIGSPAQAIVATAAERGADLIVMATHGRTGLARWVLGSVADHVVRRAQVPVLLVGPVTPPAERCGAINVALT